MDTPAWVNDLFRSIDAMDTKQFVSYLTDDAQFKFGNAPAAVGTAAISQAVDGFFKAIRSLSHKLLRTWVRPDSVACQGEVTYTRHDGSTITLPFVDVFVMEDDKIRDYLIYMDIGPLFVSQH